MVVSGGSLPDDPAALKELLAAREVLIRRLIEEIARFEALALRSLGRED